MKQGNWITENFSQHLWEKYHIPGTVVCVGKEILEVNSRAVIIKAEKSLLGNSQTLSVLDCLGGAFSFLQRNRKCLEVKYVQ